MIGLSSEQRGMLIDKLPDTANLVLGALVFGQFLSDRPFSIEVALIGIAGWFVLVGWAFLVGRGSRT